mmetsp:Transcript_12088/g.10696  ORF Transcript_12088/g.10696 Transcript_12088/m.10696 type:complete len:118 (+) Transcript_12088:422-775(+)
MRFNLEFQFLTLLIFLEVRKLVFIITGKLRVLDTDIKSGVWFFYTAQEALEKGICNQAYPNDDVLKMTEEFALSLSEKKLDPIAFQMMSKEIYGESLKALEELPINNLTSERIANYK